MRDYADTKKPAKNRKAMNLMRGMSARDQQRLYKALKHTGLRHRLSIKNMAKLKEMCEREYMEEATLISEGHAGVINLLTESGKKQRITVKSDGKTYEFIKSEWGLQVAELDGNKRTPLGSIYNGAHMRNGTRYTSGPVVKAYKRIQKKLEEATARTSKQQDVKAKALSASANRVIARAGENSAGESPDVDVITKTVAKLKAIRYWGENLTRKERESLSDTLVVVLVEDDEDPTNWCAALVNDGGSFYVVDNDDVDTRSNKRAWTDSVGTVADRAIENSEY
jgi:hypothetical protein